MLHESFPLPARCVAAALCFGLAWAAFGRRPATGEPDCRRPGIVWAAGFAAAWLVLAGDGAAFLISHYARWWLPVVGVGIVGSWFVLRRERGTPHGRRRAAGAVVLMIASPFLSRLPGVNSASASLADLVERATGIWPWEAEQLVEQAMGSAAMLLVAALIAWAAWRVPERPLRQEALPLDGTANA